MKNVLFEYELWQFKRRFIHIMRCALWLLLALCGVALIASSVIVTFIRMPVWYSYFSSNSIISYTFLFIIIGSIIGGIALLVGGFIKFSDEI